jgi:hypothetical protein
LLGEDGAGKQVAGKLFGFHSVPGRRFAQPPFQVAVVGRQGDGHRAPPSLALPQGVARLIVIIEPDKIPRSHLQCAIQKFSLPGGKVV